MFMKYQQISLTMTIKVGQNRFNEFREQIKSKSAWNRKAVQPTDPQPEKVEMTLGSPK